MPSRMRKHMATPTYFACCLEGLALIAAAEDRPDRAARLIGAATGILGAAGRVVPPADKAQGLELVAAIRDVALERLRDMQQVIAQQPAIAYAAHCLPLYDRLDLTLELLRQDEWPNFDEPEA